jgi:hypothetical protein
VGFFCFRFWLTISHPDINMTLKGYPIPLGRFAWGRGFPGGGNRYRAFFDIEVWRGAASLPFFFSPFVLTGEADRF